MGYAHTTPYTSAEIGAENNPRNVVLTTIATDTDFNESITIPSWIYAQIKKAFLLMEIPLEVNTSAAGTNATLGDQYIGVDVTGLGTYQDCLLIPTGSIPIPSNMTASAYTRFIGNIDLLSLGATTTSLLFRWKQARSLRDNLELWGIKLSLKCILGG